MAAAACSRRAGSAGGRGRCSSGPWTERRCGMAGAKAASPGSTAPELASTRARQRACGPSGRRVIEAGTPAAAIATRRLKSAAPQLIASSRPSGCRLGERALVIREEADGGPFHHEAPWLRVVDGRREGGKVEPFFDLLDVHGGGSLPSGDVAGRCVSPARPRGGAPAVLMTAARAVAWERGRRGRPGR